jgi:hypothetical protein
MSFDENAGLGNLLKGTVTKASLCARMGVQEGACA